MIAEAGGLVAHLGGLEGDLLSFARGPGPLTPLLRLGWSREQQVAPQRRIQWRDDEIWILEPVEGPLLKPPLRVRRIALDGREVTTASAGTASEGAPLSAYLDRSLPGPLNIILCGIASDHPGPFSHTLTLDLDFDLLRKPPWASGTPLLDGETLWIPVREEGVLRGSELLRGPASRAVERVGERVVCVGRGGLFVDGVWQEAMGPDWPPYRGPLSGLALPAPGGGLLLIAPTGGPLAWVGGAGGRATLPPGAYSSLVVAGGVPCGVREGREPALLPVCFDSPSRGG